MCKSLCAQCYKEIFSTIPLVNSILCEECFLCNPNRKTSTVMYAVYVEHAIRGPHEHRILFELRELARRVGTLEATFKRLSGAMNHATQLLEGQREQEENMDKE